MKIEDLAFAAKAHVEVPNGKIAVRGLNLVDILELVERHRPALSEAFDAMGGKDTKIDESMSVLTGSFLSALPEIAAEVIAIALDDPHKADVALKVAVGTQLLMLEKIAELTFAAEGGAGKVIGIVINAVRGTTQVLSVLKT